jgi:hypothetical protein
MGVRIAGKTSDEQFRPQIQATLVTAGLREAKAGLYFSPIASLPEFGQYNTREAMVEQAVSLSEIESLTQVESSRN